MDYLKAVIVLIAVFIALFAGIEYYQSQVPAIAAVAAFYGPPIIGWHVLKWIQKPTLAQRLKDEATNPKGESQT